MDQTGTDTYLTIDEPATATYTEKRSRFIATAIHVTDTDEVKQHLDAFGQKYYDARHICYAYLLGPQRQQYRANDNGEPSGTAGKPILGQINSKGLTDILVIVVRYFGGIKLGTSGLIQAYKEAARIALEAAHIQERIVEEDTTVEFEYPFLNDVMKIAKAEQVRITAQNYCGTNCQMTLSIRASRRQALDNRLAQIERLTFIKN